MNFSTNYLGGQLDRALVKSLPCLPGFNFDLNIGADRFNRAGHFTFNKGINILADQGGPRHKPGIGGLTPPPWAPIRTGPDHSVFPTSHGSKVPAWIAYDKQVLCFDAYYQEPIPESELENYRIHQCKIYFFLEDDTIQVMEPKTHNAGLPQGQIIRRHRIPLPEPCTDSFYTLEHFNVGCEVMLYGKSFKICACDAFTRKFLNRLGIPVPHNTNLPCDPGTEKMKDRKVAQFARKPHHVVDTRGPFLQHSDHVLRFWSYWDDRCKMYGDLRQFVIHYFLTDHTMEIREILKPNSGYEAFPLFLRRSQVPKTPEKLVGLPGEKTPLTILNVFGSMYGTRSKKAHYMVDNLGNQVGSDEYYRDNDLAIGAVLNIYGRPFIITNCDEFTRQYYREKYQVEDFTPLELNEQTEMEIPEPKVPPYHGWGREDDLGSCNTLEMKIAVKDYRKEAMLEKDILRFESKFHKALQHVNDSRRFVINYYMADDTIQVFEKEHPNSGLPKGNFLVRGKVKKPGHQPHIGEEPKYYATKDMFVGNILTINGFSFHLLNADEFTYSYMEANKHLFPHANICLCLEKVREAFGPLQSEEVLKCFAENDTCLQGVMDLRNFKSLLLQVTKCGLSEHEVLTLSRAYAAKTPPPGVDFLTLQAIAQTELRRFHYDRILLARVEYTFRYHDPCRTGRVDRETLRATVKGAKIPLFKDLLNFLVDKFPSPEGDLCNRVDYCDFLRFLNWEENPAPIAKPAAVQCVMKWVEPQPPMKIMCVNYRAFLEDVCPNIKCSLPAVCCCCNDNRPCPQHPNGQQETNYCGEPTSTETQIEPCQPLEPVTVFMKPCSITYTEGDNHRCAPGAQKCFLNQQEGTQDEGGRLGACGSGGGCGSGNGGGCGSGNGGGCGSGGCS